MDIRSAGHRQNIGRGRWVGVEDWPEMVEALRKWHHYNAEIEKMLADHVAELAEIRAKRDAAFAEYLAWRDKGGKNQ